MQKQSIVIQPIVDNRYSRVLNSARLDELPRNKLCFLCNRISSYDVEPSVV